VYCFDTGVLTTALKRNPPLGLIRRLALTPREEQFTTSITLAEILYGAARAGSEALARRARELVSQLVAILPFDSRAAEVYAPLRAQLERQGRRLDEPDLRIASIALARDLTLVTGNVRHFARIPDLRVENWLEA